VDAQKLYAVRNPLTKLVKIGIAIDPQKRKADLECGAGTALSILYIQEVKHAKTAESYVHSALEPYKCFREWFALKDAAKLEELFREAAKLENAQAHREERESKWSSYVRDEVKQALFKQGVTQVKLAESLGISRTHLNDMLNSKSSIIPARLEQLLDELGLELYVGKRSE
jgi:predicted XRE-type DNA-binding protein